MSHKMTDITIDAPPSKMLNDVSREVSQGVCESSCTVVIKLRQIAPMTQPKVWTGDLTKSTSDSSPITSDPIMPPTEPRDVILPAASLEYPNSS